MKTGKSESIEQASTKVVNSRDFKTQGQSKFKEKQEQTLEEPEHGNLFSDICDPDVRRRTQARTRG